MTSIDAAISNAEVLIFAPRIRKTGQDIKIEINSKFKDLVSNAKKGLYCCLWIRNWFLVEILKMSHY